MKKYILWSALIVTSFISGYSANSFAVPKNNSDLKIATVDIQKIVLNSPEMLELKSNQEKQLKTMQNTIEKAKQEISKEKDPQKIAQIEDKYRIEINNQKISYDEAYSKKMTAINNKIRTAVVEKARSMNYNVVLAKNTVLFGGEDITDQVSGLIK